jgi:hypothetical protein
MFMPRFSSFSTLLLAVIAICIAPVCQADETDDFHVMKNEAFGALKIDMPALQVKVQVAEMPAMGPKRLWGADGMMHQTWKYPNLGLEIDMTSEDKKAAQTVSAITVKAPSILQTRRGIHVGSRESEVAKAYKGDISKEESKPGQTIVAGSLYGGVVFTIEKGVVSTMFLGAAAE